MSSLPQASLRVNPDGPDEGSQILNRNNRRLKVINTEKHLRFLVASLLGMTSVNFKFSYITVNILRICLELFVLQVAHKRNLYIEGINFLAIKA